MVNNTKKEIRKVTIIFTSENNNIGLVDCLIAIVNSVKEAWNNFTKYNWETSDSIDMMKDADCNLSDYEVKGYALKWD
jgi:hypothetical protein